MWACKGECQNQEGLSKPPFRTLAFSAALTKFNPSLTSFQKNVVGLTSVLPKFITKYRNRWNPRTLLPVLVPVDALDFW